MFKYYMVYQHSGGTGSKYIHRDTALDSEEALLEEHNRLEQEMGRSVVILSWRRID